MLMEIYNHFIAIQGKATILVNYIIYYSKVIVKSKKKEFPNPETLIDAINPYICELCH